MPIHRHAMVLLAALGSVPLTPARAQDPGSVYQAVTLRAAPGHLVELIDLLRARLPVHRAAGEAEPLLLRHSQGDHWDLMLLVPIESIETHFSRNRAGRWRDAVRRTGHDDAAWEAALDRLVSWREELYLNGPPVTELHTRAAAAGVFHLEVFQALAGKRDSLRRQREMENDYLERVGRPTNFVFTKITGPPWDLFTLGFYRDMPHYAEPAAVSVEAAEQAAVAAGFASRGDIGPYLRRFLSSHHDTIGTIVR